MYTVCAFVCVVQAHVYVRYRGGCGGHAERKKISHSPLQRDFQRIRKIKKTTLKFYSVSNRAEEGGREEESWARVQNRKGICR